MKIKNMLMVPVLLMSTFINVYAENDSSEFDESFVTESTYYSDQVNSQYEDYLRVCKAESFEELDSAEKNIWLLKMEEIKTQCFGGSSENSINITANVSTNLSDYTGGILISFDQSMWSWNHGHAAMGYQYGTVEILGPGHVVTNYGGLRIAAFQNSSTGGFYTVRNATGANNHTAAQFAYGFIGESYFTDDPSGFSCSNLVSTAWALTGFSINGLTPHTLAGDSNTILQFTW